MSGFVIGGVVGFFNAERKQFQREQHQAGRASWEQFQREHHQARRAPREQAQRAVGERTVAGPFG